jgi:hypothetical protein
MILAESLRCSIFAEDRPAIAHVRHIKYVVVNFPSHDGDDSCAPAMVRVEHCHLAVDFREYGVNGLIQLDPLTFLNLFSKLDGEHFLTVLAHGESSVAIEDSEKSTRLISGNLVQMATGVLHCWSIGSVFVLCICVFFNA